MISIENLEKELKNNHLNSMYLLYGEELFLLETSLKKIKTLFGECIKGINFISIDDTNVEQLIADIETPAFGYEKKLIIARNTGLFKKEGKRKNTEISKLKDKINKYIQENSKLIEESVVLVFAEEEADSKQELYKTIQEIGIVSKFDIQKPIQIEKRMKSICNAYKVQIDDSTLRYFIECCGTNMQDLINEIRKLIEYAGENGKIKKEDVDKLVTKKLESIIFDLTDNLGKKNIEKALQVAEYYKKDIIKSLKLKPNQTFLVNKYKMQAKYFKTKELKEILQDLRDLDYQYKNGIIDLQIGLEAILCKYCS